MYYPMSNTLVIGSSELLATTRQTLPNSLGEAVRWVPVLTTRHLPCILPDTTLFNTNIPERYWFASPVAIDSFLKYMRGQGLSRLCDENTRVGVVGTRCAIRLAQIGVSSQNIQVSTSLFNLCNQWQCTYPVRFFRVRNADQSYRALLRQPTVEITAYETVPVVSLHTPVAVKEGDCLVFTSPRCVQHFDALHEAQFGGRPCRDLKVCALGPTTQNAVKAAGYRRITCAPYPNLRHVLLQLLLQAEVLQCVQRTC